MADDNIDTQSIESFNKAVQGLLRDSNALQRHTMNEMRRQQERERLTDDAHKKHRARLKDFDRTINSRVSTFNEFTKSGDGVISFLKNFAEQGRGFLGLGVFSALAYNFNQLSKNWQQLTNHGQTFGGSMFNMMQQANDAGLSLEEFADVYRDHNLVIKATNGGFFTMQKELRKNVAANGNYGMTVEQLTNFMGRNMEVSRRNGSLQSKSSSAYVAEMAELAVTTTSLAAASDKTREQIMELANAAMSSSLSIANLALMPAEIRDSASKSITEATAVFASMAGESGDFFSKFFNETLGSSASLTQQGQLAIDAGMSNVASEMDALARKFNTNQGSIDDVIAFQDRFKKSYEAQLPVLRAQAAAGNDNARQMIQYGSAMQKLTRADMERNKANAESTELLTAFFSSFDSIFKMLKGSLISSFLKGMGNVGIKMDEFASSKSFEQITTLLNDVGKTWGESFGKFISTIKADDVASFMEGLKNGVIGLGYVIIGFGKVFGWITSVFNSIGAVADRLGTNLGEIAISIMGAVLAFKAISGVMKVRDFLAGGKAVTVKGGVVNVVGGNGASSMGDLLGDDPDGGGRGKKGGMRRNLKARGLRMGRNLTRRPGIVGGISRMGAKAISGIGGLFGSAGGSAAASAGEGLLGRFGPSLLKNGAGILKGGLGALAGMGLGMLSDNMEQGTMLQKTVGVGAKAANWAGTGAMLGSVVPGLGTAAGAVIGGSLGAASGLYDALTTPTKETKEETKEEEPKKSEESRNEITDKTLVELKKINEELAELRRITNQKLEQSNRLLSKIEVSAQSFS